MGIMRTTTQSEDEMKSPHKTQFSSRSPSTPPTLVLNSHPAHRMSTDGKAAHVHDRQGYLAQDSPGRASFFQHECVPGDRVAESARILCTVFMHVFACVRVMSAHLLACLRWYCCEPGSREATPNLWPHHSNKIDGWRALTGL
jgi:hypothetical protein